MKKAIKNATPNLGTHRDSDHVLSPQELPTVRVAGEKPPYQISAAVSVVHSFREQEITGCGLDPVDRSGYPDVHEIAADMAHTKTPLTVQSRDAVRESFGGGAGETKASRTKRGHLQDTGDRPADRPKARP